MMYYRISKNEKILFFGKKNRPGVGSDLNNVTKFHKILIKNILLRERISFKMVNFHKQRAITTESMVPYRPLSNLKKTSWY